MLLSTCNSSIQSIDAEKPNPINDFLRSISGQEKEQDIISIEHNYSRLWNCHPDSHHAKPARMLFVKGLFHHNEASSESDAVIDVETVPSHTVLPYDTAKTRAMLLECDHFLEKNLSVEGQEEKEPLNKSGWSTTQKNLYKHVMKVINSDRLSRLAYSGTSDELVKRKISIDKGACKMRQLFAANSWDMKLLCWLHCTLLENLSSPLLSEYFEILRALKAKVPNLTDKFLAQVGTYNSSIFGSSSTEALNQLLHKPWDPILTEVSQHKPPKLPGNPLILIVPSSPNHTSTNQSQRMRFWNSQLSALGKVVQLPVHSSLNIAVDECLNHIFTMARNKVVEMRSHSPKRPIILLGWTIGALIACHVALEETVNAIVCLGFPLKGITGSRGDLDDPLLDSKVPTLFVIGQNSSTCSMDDIEDFRERMRAETGLVVVGGADDMLRVSVTKKKAEGVTQAMVDKCVVDEIGDFLAPLLNQQHSTVSSSHSVANKKVSHAIQQQQLQHQQQMPFVTDDAKRQRRRPREYSPEISPVRRKSRPVGRPSMQKMLSSTSSSDTSSVGSCANEGTLRKDKRSSVSRGSRPNSNVLRRHPKPKTVIQAQKINPNESPRRERELKINVKDSSPPSSVTTAAASASSNPNAAKILAEQQKNGPVDVEKAFGKDSSFLPRPLTPAEFDGGEPAIVSSNPNDKPSELLALASEHNNNVEDSIATTQSELISNRSAVISVSLSNILSSPEKQKISFLKTSTGSYPLTTFSTHVNSTVAIQKPQVVSKISESVFDQNKACIASLQKLQSSDLTAGSVIPGKSIITTSQNKILTSGGLNVKHVQSIVSSLTGKGLLASTVSSPAKSQTLLMGSPSSANKSAFFMSNNEGSASPSSKIQFRRMVVQGSSPRLPLLSKLASPISIVDDSKASHSTEQRVCNLSLLSDVAGMKEPIKQSVHDVQTSNATLVKLTSSPDAASTFKRIRVIEAVPSPSSSTHPSRFETPEELAEKQMAIRALSSSLNEGNEDDDANCMNYPLPSSSKMDTSMAAHQLSMRGYSIVMPKSGPGLGIRPPSRRSRGRALSSFPFGRSRSPRVQRYYPF